MDKGPIGSLRNRFRIGETATMITTAETKGATPKTTKPAPKAERRRVDARRMATLLKQLSDPTRLQVLHILAAGERHVGALCADLSLNQAGVSHHLALLRHGGLVAPRRQGKNNFYALTGNGRAMAAIATAVLDSSTFRL